MKSYSHPLATRAGKKVSEQVVSKIASYVLDELRCLLSFKEVDCLWLEL